MVGDVSPQTSGQELESQVFSLQVSFVFTFRHLYHVGMTHCLEGHFKAWGGSQLLVITTVVTTMAAAAPRAAQILCFIVRSHRK